LPRDSWLSWQLSFFGETIYPLHSLLLLLVLARGS